MLMKRLLAISLLLPLVAISATAHAGSTITDKSYWPSEVRRTTTYGVIAPQSNPTSAFASSAMTPRLQAAPIADEGNIRRYHGGPKS
jgi:hypothetical protein